MSLVPGFRKIHNKVGWKPGHKEARYRVESRGPTLAPRQLSKSFFMSDTATLSWGLFGPLQQGTTVFKSNSTTCSPKPKAIIEFIKK